MISVVSNAKGRDKSNDPLQMLDLRQWGVVNKRVTSVDGQPVCCLPLYSFYKWDCDMAKAAAGASGRAPDGDTGDRIASLLRADGGLVALNLAALTLVAGAEKLDFISDFVNLEILISGLCIGLFFAILGTYYTVFGMRATAIRVEEQKPVPPRVFDPAFSGIRIGRPVVILVTPILTLLVLTTVWNAAITSPASLAASTGSIAYRDCLWKQGAKENAGEHYLITDKAGTKAVSECKTTKSEMDRLRRFNDESQNLLSLIQNVTLSAVLILFICLPFLVWSAVLQHLPGRTEKRRTWHYQLLLGKRQKLLPRTDGTERPSTDSVGGQLDRQIEAIQGYRTACAVTSLGAFMLGVGLALINVSAASVGPGIVANTPIVAKPPVTEVNVHALRPTQIPVVIGQPGNPEQSSPPKDVPVDKAPPPQVLPQKVEIDLRGLPMWRAFGEPAGPPTINLRVDPAPAPQVKIDIPPEISLKGLPVTQTVPVLPVVGPKGEPGPPGKMWICTRPWPGVFTKRVCKAEDSPVTPSTAQISNRVAAESGN